MVNMDPKNFQLLNRDFQQHQRFWWCFFAIRFPYIYREAKHTSSTQPDNRLLFVEKKKPALFRRRPREATPLVLGNANWYLWKLSDSTRHAIHLQRAEMSRNEYCPNWCFCFSLRNSDFFGSGYMKTEWPSCFDYNKTLFTEGVSNV